MYIEQWLGASIPSSCTWQYVPVVHVTAAFPVCELHAGERYVFNFNNAWLDVKNGVSRTMAPTSVQQGGGGDAKLMPAAGAFVGGCMGGVGCRPSLRPPAGKTAGCSRGKDPAGPPCFQAA